MKKVNKINNEEDALKEIKRLEKEMMKAAHDLRFEEAAEIRDKIRAIKENMLFGAVKDN